MKKRIIAQIIILSLVIAAFGWGGYLLTRNGKDAATVNNEKKNCLLMADQHNVSFQSVGGRVMEVYVKEGQIVSQDDTLMTLDTTDIDLQIKQVAGDAAVLDRQITAAQAAIQKYDRNVLQYGVQTAELAVQTAQDNYAKQTTLKEHERNILQYRTQTAELAVQTAQDNYGKQKELYDNQVIAQTVFTDAETKLKNANLALAQSQEELDANQVATQTVLTDAETKLKNANLALAQSKESLQKAESALDKAQLDISVLQEQKVNLALRIENLTNQKNRMTLKAPQSGKVLTVIAKTGENVNANAPVVVIRSGGIYFDLYVPETNVSQFKEGAKVQVYVVALDKTMTGTIRLVQSAPQYTNTRMTRDNAQGDLTSFQIRIYLEEQENGELLPGMTVEVLLDAANI